MDGFRERFKKARADSGLTQKELAKRSGVSQPTISDIERGRNDGSREVVALALAMGKHPQWLAKGTGPEDLSPRDLSQAQGPAGQVQTLPGKTRPEGNPEGTVGNEPATIPRRLPDNSPGPDFKGSLPLISWVQAGRWSEIVDTFHPGDAENWYQTTRTHGPHAFVLRVEGVSMQNPGHKLSFDPGDLIFIDPDRPYHHGSLVVAKIPGEEMATFKQLLIEGSRYLLQALNPAWPERIFEMPEGGKIVGVVFSKTVDYA